MLGRIASMQRTRAGMAGLPFVDPNCAEARKKENLIAHDQRASFPMGSSKWGPMLRQPLRAAGVQTEHPAPLPIRTSCAGGKGRW